VCAHCAAGHVGLRYLCGVLATDWKVLVRVEGGVAQFVRTAAKATGSCQPSLGVVIAIAIAASSSISEMMTGSRELLVMCPLAHAHPHGRALEAYETELHDGATKHIPRRKTWP